MMFAWFRRKAPQVCAGISPQVSAENHLFTQVPLLNRSFGNSCAAPWRNELAKQTPGTFYRRYMDDWAWVFSNKQHLRKAMKNQYTVLHALRVAMHPAKTFIGKIAKGFDFLGFHISPTGVTVSAAALSRHEQKVSRLYEQGASTKRIRDYRMRWLAWVGLLVALPTAGNTAPSRSPSLHTGCNVDVTTSDVESRLFQPYMYGNFMVTMQYAFPYITDTLMRGSLEMVGEYSFSTFSSTPPRPLDSWPTSKSDELPPTIDGDPEERYLTLGGSKTGYCVYSYTLTKTTSGYSRNTPQVFSPQTNNDTTAPTVGSFSPADEATNIATDANLIITFSEAMEKGTGNIIIKKSSEDSEVETLAVTASTVTINSSTVTINPATTLAKNTAYYVTIDSGAFKDSAGNPYAGITDKTTWNFTTIANQAPSITGVNVSGILTFGETLTAAATGFTDQDGDSAGTHGYQWYRASDAACTTDKTEITGATSNTYTLTTNDPGKYICATITPKDNDGMAGDPATGTTASTIGKAAQTLTFAAATPTSKTLGDAKFTVTATGGASEETVVLGSSTASVCTVSGNDVTLVAAGTCTLTANQAGNDNYAAATQVTHAIIVSKPSQTVAFAPETPTSKTFAPNGTFTLTASSTSSLPVSFSSTTPEVCTVKDHTVTMLKVGDCALTATQAGDDNYSAAIPVNRTVVIGKADQTLTFAQPAEQAFQPNGRFSVSASSSANLTVAFASGTASVCTVSGNTVTMHAIGTCRLTASQAGDSNYNAATDISRDVVIRNSLGIPSISATSPVTLVATDTVSAYSLTTLGVAAADNGVSLTPVAYYRDGACADTVPADYATACSPVASAGFTSGQHSLWWVVQDSDGNRNQAAQTLNVVPVAAILNIILPLML